MTTTDTTTANGTQATAAALAKAKEPGGSIAAFSNQANFETAQRMAKALASSSLVPQQYQNNLANVLIAMELASRIGASVFAVMQNIDIIHGRPSWRSTFLIATVNACGRFTPIRFRFEGQPGTDEWGCRAVAKDKDTGEECVGALITIGLAKAEGWTSRNGSKWKTMPEQMLMYRAAAFWTRVYAPEQSLGMTTAEEVIDTYGYTVEEVKAPPAGNAKALEAALLGTAAEAASAPESTPAAEAASASAPQTPEVTEAPAVEGKRTRSTKAKAAPREEIDPITGEVLPPPNAGDAWEPEAGV